ncbi:MAG: Dam family site-specific DNA-(adenine-N6)-methyltransferase [Bacillota bacterium]
MLKSKNGMIDILKPPLKWAGGKRWLLFQLKPIWEILGQRRLVEPFCGGLAVTLGLLPAESLLNDINPHLMNFFYQVKYGLYIDIPLKNDSDYYYKCRDHFNRLLQEGKENTADAAKLFYYLNRTGYNGLCRFNKKGGFNVPFGKYKAVNYKRDFSEYRQVFERWDFSCGDFADLDLYDNDFIYADPPYDVDFTQYAREGFGWEDQVRLAEWLSAHPGPVVLSNQATERIVKLYEEFGFKLFYLDGPRRISCTGDRTPAKEILALKGCGYRALYSLLQVGLENI